MFKQHQNILSLKKLFKIYGIQVKNDIRNSLSYGLNTFCFDSSTNYLIIYNFDRSNPCALLHNNIKTLQLHWDSLETITNKLIKYGILPIQTLSITQRTKTKASCNVEQSKQIHSNKKNYKLLG